ncbi:ATP F0F1 synthase subunit gamma [Nonlabens sp. YIK11]|uniref:ATP synthase F1 subunit gamma n=1 Tax=Nonlabens sp. YIK11 TaxID=1453349 RepID=UPI0006DC2454|nr:ATP synthase F1 subunit gamma [Nonlabens sp. YIK11]KQC32315.1 ATP F0F1 synthase subunit gamma [Nonlabens sp. YIK11]
MANLKEIRNRITSVSSTMQITSAMKMVSAAKLKKAQDAITAMRPYSDKLTELLQNLSASMEGDAGSKYAEQREVKRALVVAITSNRGLAGAFNSNIIKELIRLNKEDLKGVAVSYMTIGKKANDFAKKGSTIQSNKSDLFDDISFDKVSAIAEELMELFVTGEFDKIVLVYNSFKNAATQVVMSEDFLPLKPLDQVEGEAPANATEYIYEPSKEEIIEQLIPKSLKMQLYKGVRDSWASEHGARMTAMHKATDNATELRDQLKLTYNKARQAAITNEILEIVGGAEALNN